jgi:PKD repeat protein
MRSGGIARRVLLLAGSLALFYLGLQARVQISRSQYGVCWSPRMAIADSGTIHVVWLEAYSQTSGDVFYSRRPAGSETWTTPVNLSNSGRVACETYVACCCGLDNSQRLYVVWGEVGNGIMLRTLAGDSWSGTELAASFSDPDFVRISVDGAGNLFIIWFSYGGGEVYSRARVGGNWEGTRLVSDSRFRAKFPDISVNNGVVYAVFTERTEDYEVAYCRRNADFNAGWTAPAEVYSEFPLAHHQPKVAVDSSGVAQIVYPHVLPDDSGNCVAFTYWTGSGFAAPIELSGWTFTHWPFIINRNGVNHVLWQEGSYYGGDLYFRSGQGSSWSGTNYVPESGGATHMDLDLDPQGKLGFVWSADGEVYYGTSTPGGGGGGGGGGGTVPPPKPNQPPVADFNFLPNSGFAPLEVQFDGTASYDPDGMVVQWNWLFGDGDSGSSGNIYHTYQTQGLFQVKLTVVDNLGLTASAVKSIEVLGVNPPLNVRWQTFVDESVFLTRYVTEVTWERNPANDRYNIVQQNIYRKNNEEGGSWKYIGRTTADVFNYRDTDVKQKDVYAYSVTVIDAQGHESRVGAQGGGNSLSQTSQGRSHAAPRPRPGSTLIKKD